MAAARPALAGLERTTAHHIHGGARSAPKWARDRSASIRHSRSIPHFRPNDAQASAPTQSEEELAELRRLVQENTRMKQLMAEHAERIPQDRLQHFASEFATLAQQAGNLELELEPQLMQLLAQQAATAASAAPASLEESASAAAAASSEAPALQEVPASEVAPTEQQAPEPAAAAAPAAEPAAELETAQAPELVAQPVAAATSDTHPVTAAAHEAEPAQQVEPEPAPVAAAMPTILPPTEKTVPEPASVPEPAPAPESEPVPEPEAKPAAEPVAKSAPEPVATEAVSAPAPPSMSAAMSEPVPPPAEEARPAPTQAEGELESVHQSASSVEGDAGDSSSSPEHQVASQAAAPGNASAVADVIDSGSSVPPVTAEHQAVAPPPPDPLANAPSVSEQQPPQTNSATTVVSDVPAQQPVSAVAAAALIELPSAEAVEATPAVAGVSAAVAAAGDEAREARRYQRPDGVEVEVVAMKRADTVTFSFSPVPGKSQSKGRAGGGGAGRASVRAIATVRRGGALVSRGASAGAAALVASTTAAAAAAAAAARGSVAVAAVGGGGCSDDVVMLALDRRRRVVFAASADPTKPAAASSHGNANPANRPSSNNGAGSSGTGSQPSFASTSGVGGQSSMARSTSSVGSRSGSSLDGTEPSGRSPSSNGSRSSRSGYSNGGGSRFGSRLSQDDLDPSRKSLDKDGSSTGVSPEITAARKQARTTVAGHTAEGAATDRHHWLMFTVPEVPVGGEEVVLYFNRNQSESLRNRQRVLVQYAFNHWELQPEAGKLEMQPAGVSKDYGADFLSIRLKVPEAAYEMNFIFTDGESSWENNMGQDFTLPVVAGSTWDDWVDGVADRAAAAEAKRQAEDKVKAEEEVKRQKEADAKADADKGRAMANDLKTSRDHLQAGGCNTYQTSLTPGAPVLWRTEPEQVRAGFKGKILYNLAVGPLGRLSPLPQGAAPVIRYGFNGWKKPGQITLVPAKVAPVPRPATGVAPGSSPAAPATRPAVDKADWWAAEIDIPLEAVAINFVLNVGDQYDNNGGKDYKAAIDVPIGATVDSWSSQLAEIFRKDLEATRAVAEEAARVAAAKRAKQQAEAQALVKAVERRKVRHVLFTSPEVVTAGQKVTVYYSPIDTPLNGSQAIYIKGGWNRWSHARSFGPIAMTPPEEGFHWQATVTVPKDAYKMDFIFSNVESGDGAYDNRGGFDYHLPVEGSPVREPRLHVVHISVEMAPIAKVGGLGDVVTALGRAVQELGHTVEVIMPRYEFLSHSPVLQGTFRDEVQFDWGGCRIFVTSAMVEGLRVFFIDPRNGFFHTPAVYGRYDDEVRFDFFCKAALEFLLHSGRQPDILHCHDWATAHVAKAYWEDYHNYGLWKPKVLFTIHNLEYGKKKIAEAAYYCQKFTTVSPTYAYEVGGNPVIAPHLSKFVGIRNGVDPELWSPEDNPFLPVPYDATTHLQGKAAARQRLREWLGLSRDRDRIMVGVVSRLTPQKGVSLIRHTAYRTMERGGQFVLLGSAPDPKIQAEFNELAGALHGDNNRFCFKYDEPLSHLIYAACDIIVVPSEFEPCGLTQMIAMRYGAIPVVRHTGGLRDTVFDVDFDKARGAWDMYGSSDPERDGLDATNGFAFAGMDTGALDYALNRAIDAYYNDNKWFRGLQRRIMEQDWSWARPALDYVELMFAAQKS